jgi:hypothetical protein
VGRLGTLPTHLTLFDSVRPGLRVLIRLRFWWKNKSGDEEASSSSDAEDGNSSYCIASDGTYVFICHSEEGFFKIGSGYGGSVQGKIYCSNPCAAFCAEDAWLGYANVGLPKFCGIKHQKEVGEF